MERKGASYSIKAKRPASHHGEHTQRTQVSDMTFADARAAGQPFMDDPSLSGEALFKVGGTYHAMSGITPEVEGRMSNDEWLRYNTRKYGHGGV